MLDKIPYLYCYTVYWKEREKKMLHPTEYSVFTQIRFFFFKMFNQLWSFKLLRNNYLTTIWSDSSLFPPNLDKEKNKMSREKKRKNWHTKHYLSHTKISIPNLIKGKKLRSQHPKHCRMDIRSHPNRIMKNAVTTNWRQ